MFNPYYIILGFLLVVMIVGLSIRLFSWINSTPTLLDKIAAMGLAFYNRGYQHCKNGQKAEEWDIKGMAKKDALLTVIYGFLGSSYIEGYLDASHEKPNKAKETVDNLESMISLLNTIQIDLKGIQ